MRPPSCCAASRSTQDYEYERVMRHINADMAPKVCTVFLMPPRDTAELSSSMIKGLIGPEGWESQVSRYVPPNVFALLKKKYKTLTEEMRRQGGPIGRFPAVCLLPSQRIFRGSLPCLFRRPPGESPSNLDGPKFLPNAPSRKHSEARCPSQ